MTIILDSLFKSDLVESGHRVEFKAADDGPVPEDGYLTSEVVRVFTPHSANPDGNQYVPMLYGRAACFYNGKREAAQVLGDLAQPDTDAGGNVVGRRVLFKDVPLQGRRYEFSMGVKRVKVASLLEDALALFTGLSKDVSTLVPGLDTLHSVLEPLFDKLDTGVGLISRIADFGGHDFEVYTNDALNHPVEGFVAYISHPTGGPVLNNQKFQFNETDNQLEMWNGMLFVRYTASSYMVVRFSMSDTSGQYAPLLVDGKKRLTDLVQTVDEKDITALQLRGMLSGVVNTVLQRAVHVLSKAELANLETKLNEYISQLFAPLPTAAVIADVSVDAAAGMPPAPDVAASLKAATDGSPGSRHLRFLRKAGGGPDEIDVDKAVIDMPLTPEDWTTLRRRAASLAAEVNPWPGEGPGAGAAH